MMMGGESSQNFGSSSKTIMECEGQPYNENPYFNGKLDSQI